MDICHVYNTTKEARLAFDEFVWSNAESEYMLLFRNIPYTVVLNGDNHYFMSDYIYSSWCKGRTYMLNDEMFHSGYLIRR